MTFAELGLLVLIALALFLAYWFLIRRKDDENAPPKAKNMEGEKARAKPLAAARRFARLHAYQVIAPAQLAKNGKFADLDFIVIGYFGLLCVKCVGLGGEIYGNSGDAMWLQVTKTARTSFPNPMQTLPADTRLVRDALFTAGLKNIPVETVCVFTNKKATLALPRSTGHLTVKEFSQLLGKDKYLQDKGVNLDNAAAAIRAYLVTSQN